MWRELDSIEFMTFVHASPPRISCNEHGIIEAVIPWTEKRSRFTLRFETRSIRMLQNIDTYSFTDIMKLSWNQAWNILDRAVKGGIERKRGNPSIIGIDEKSYRKGHKYITLVYGMMNNGVEYISYDRKKKSLDQYYNTLSREQLSSISAVSMDMWEPFMCKRSSKSIQNRPCKIPHSYLSFSPFFHSFLIVCSEFFFLSLSL